MKKLIFLLPLLFCRLLAGSAYDVVLSQINSANTGFQQVNVSPPAATAALVGFNTSQGPIPVLLGTGLSITGSGPYTLNVSAGGNVSNTGTPTANQIAVWTSATVVEGLTGSGSTFLGLLGSGTPSSSTYLRGDGSWQTISGGGVTSVATSGGITGGTITTTGTVSLDLTYSPTMTGIWTHSPTARTSGAAPYWVLNVPADTGITASTESKGINVVGATRTWVDGTTTLQEEYYFGAPTYNKTTTSATFTTAATVSIGGLPAAGAGVTITNPVGLLVTANALATATQPALQITNTTAAANGAQQYSPALIMYGQGWGTTGGASQQVGVRQYCLPLQATVGRGQWVVEFQDGGGGWSNAFTANQNTGFAFSLSISASNITSINGMFLGTNNTIGWSSRSKIASPADGIFELTNNAATGFTRLQLGGTTSSFVALQTSGTTLTIGTADGGTGAGALTVSGTLYAAGSAKFSTTGASAPGTSTVTLPTSVYGGGTVVLTSPTGWMTILDSGGTSRVVAYY